MDYIKRLKMISLIICLSISCFTIYASTTPSSEPEEALNLISFVKNVEDPAGILSSWDLSNKNVCQWRGIGCNQKGNVIEIVLDSMSLSGNINIGELKLSDLQKISLSNNGFTGILFNLSSISNVDHIDMSRNNFSDTIKSDSFTACGRLRFLSLSFNKFKGGIPDCLSSCSYLEVVNFASNQFSGSFPTAVLALTKLKSLDFSDNKFEGRMPEGVGGFLALTRLNLSRNQLYGELPETIWNCTNVRSLDFSENSFCGYLSDSLKRLNHCNYMNLRGNLFTGGIPDGIGKMGMLDTLDISNNNFVGGIPDSFGNLKSLRVLNASRNMLEGGFPSSLVSCSKLSILDLGGNHLSGVLPQRVGEMGVEELVLRENNFNGSIYSLLDSDSVKMRVRLEVLDLSENELTGSIPFSIGRFGRLKVLNLSSCFLEGNLPETMKDLRSLSVVNIGDNMLDGEVPSWIGNMASLEEIRLNRNRFSGEIPASIGNCSSLIILSLSENSLHGTLPASIGDLSNLQHLDLSSNNLTGYLPQHLIDLHSLYSFNISHNKFRGKLPPNPFFNTLDPSSFSSNPFLCGPPLKKPCTHEAAKPIVLDPNPTPSTALPSRTHRKNSITPSTMIAMAAGASILFGVIAITVVNLTVRTPVSRLSPLPTFSTRDEDLSVPPSLDFEAGHLVMFSGDSHTSFPPRDLFQKDRELGRGHTGVVYHTILPDGSAVAVKKMANQASWEEFKNEAERLGRLNHRNLVKLHGYYWTPWMQLLIHEYVEEGSAYSRLHENQEEGVEFPWGERVKVIMGTARCLEYMHRRGVVHGNVKTSNVMVDGENEAKVGDAGVVGLVEEEEGGWGRKGDVYGFGVMVVEVVSGRMAVEYRKDDVVGICDVVRVARKEGRRLEEWVDTRVEEGDLEEAVMVMKVGLICSSQVVSERPEMEEVLQMLQLIRSSMD